MQTLPMVSAAAQLCGAAVLTVSSLRACLVVHWHWTAYQGVGMKLVSEIDGTRPC